MNFRLQQKRQVRIPGASCFLPIWKHRFKRCPIGLKPHAACTGQFLRRFVLFVEASIVLGFDGRFAISGLFWRNAFPHEDF